MTDTIRSTVEDARREDVQDLEASLRDIIADAAEQLLDGTAEDLQVYAIALQEKLAHGLATGNRNIVDSVHRQVRLLGEQQRIRANDAAWSVFERIVANLGQIVLVAGDIALGKAFGAVRSIR